jgi:hypothetical protein
LLALQASVNVPRSAFGTCISEAAEKAKSDKVNPDGFAEFLRTACDPAAAKLKNALIAFDTKNGVARARATEDAQMELDDTLDAASRSYKRLHQAKAQ